VENFPTIGSISGSELGDRLTSQAMDQGAEVELDEVTAISRNTGAFKT
jgi:thioredoxin reductase